jgi:ABC-2 type transport system permease protein
MKTILDIYRAYFRVAVATQLQYRASGAIWMIWSILEPLIFLVVWSTVAIEQGGAVQGFGPHDFAAYYMVLFVVNHLTFSWVMHDMQFRIQFGHFSFALMRPVHPIHEDICDNVAYKLVMLVMTLPALVVLYVLFDPRFDTNVTAVLAFFPLLLTAFLMRFMFEWALALAAFWTTRVTALNQIYFSLLMFFAGRVAPIALLPPLLQTIAAKAPFYYMVGFPVDVLLGHVDTHDLWTGFLTQLFWLAGAWATVTFAWRRSVAQFSAVGT